MNDKVEKTEETAGEIVLYQPDESITMEVRLDASHDTVWLNRQQMAELFERDVKTIGKHINNALKEELAVDSVGAKNATAQRRTENPTVANFAIVQKEGERTVTRQVEYYNLDMILSVGYRVKSNRGIQFRRWANQVLKQHLLNGYSVNRHLIALQQRETFDADLEKHNRQYPAIRKVQLPQKEHDRFLMIDDTVYILGDSLKDLGHSMTTVLKTSFTVEEIVGKLW